MIIITDCLTEKVDEGCLKVANSLVKEIKKSEPQTIVLSYGSRRSNDTDIYLKLNKLFLNKRLFDEILKNSKENILYVPFSSNTLASIVRTCILSIFSKRKVAVLFALRHSMNQISEYLLRHGKFHIVTISRKSFDYYDKLAKGRVLYLKTGIDLDKFTPVENEDKQSLRIKYGLDVSKPVVLHVGHLHNGRNIEILSGISQDKQVILVVSSVSEQDRDLRKRLESKENIRIIDQYLPEIQEIYQLSDAYIFPVIQEENSIDVPLSVLEAASCNLSILATPYGELKEFKGEKGIIFRNEITVGNVDEELNMVLNIKEFDNHKMVIPYDWKYSSDTLEKWMLAF